MNELARVDARREGRVAVAAISGEIDSSNVDRVMAGITAAVPNELDGLVIDLADVRYLDSAGVGLLFAVANGLTSSGQQLRVSLPQTSLIRRVLELTSANVVIPIDASVEAAVAAIADAGAR